LINKKLQAKQLSKKLGIKMNDFMPKITMIYPNSAKVRIQNQLSYKLGQAMIVNSKSILGYIRMPFVLSYIYDKHKQEQKIYQEKIKKDSSLILPQLESYPDYKEALKEKECFTYKLGQALIQANKTWYGGGYIRLLFEIRKLKREFYIKKDIR
ncbi:sugar transferase, partial [Campylobacter jejuni]